MTARRPSAVLAVLLIGLAVLPAAAIARPANDGLGPRSAEFSKPTASSPVPTVVRTTVVKEEAARALPIALAGAALLIAIAGTGYAAFRIAPMRQQLRGLH
jgi:hypothetical protein